MAEMDNEITKFENLCQCCLTEEGILKNMRTENFKGNESHSLSAIYKQCSGIMEISTEESCSFGQRICESCVHQLTVTYEFREQCKTSYKVLKARYDLLIEFKEEPMSDDEPLILNNHEPGKRTQVFVRHKIKPEKFVFIPPIDAKEETTEVITGALEISVSAEPDTNDNNDNSSEPEDKDTAMFDKTTEDINVTPKKIVPKPTEEYQDEVETMLADFVCYYCDAVLKNHSDYIIHRENHVMEHTTIAKARSISRNCFLCGEFQISYVKHLENEHKDFYPNKCKKCTKSFRSPKLLKKHLYKHLNSETFECLGCNKKFRSHCQRRSHLSLEKHSRDVYRCSVCGLGCEKYLNLHQHFKKEHKHQNTKQLFPCYDCRSVFSYMKYFLQHKCSDAGKRKRSLDSLPPGAPIFTCDRCSQKFADEDEMVCHQFTVCSARSKCPDCGKVLENRHALLNHLRRHEQKGSFICDECGFSACSAPKLAIHKEKHKPATRVNYIKCPHPGCTAELKSDYTLQSHLRRHGEGQFECYLCQKKFRHRVTIQGHMIKFHIPEEQLLHVCVCGKRFFTARDLKIHARLHNDDRPMRCKFCPKAYRDPANLKEHVRRAHEGIHYECIYCNKKYSERMKMKEHLFIHRGFRPYNCPVCSVPYTKRFLYIKHLLSHGIKFDEDIHGYQEKEDINETLKACKRVPATNGQLVVTEAEPSEMMATTVHSFYSLQTNEEVIDFK